MFYVLGSIPSRLFISAILIHWTTAEDPNNLPVAVGTLILAAVLLIKPVRDMWKGERSYFLLHGVSYIAIAVFMFVNIKNNAMIAGIWLILDTIVSGYMWYNRGRVVKVTTTPKYKKLQLQNLRF